MAATAKALARTTLTTSSVTLYTVPSATTAIVTNIVLANITSSDATVDLLLDGVELLKEVKVAANSTSFIDMKQVLAATDTITGLASANTTITIHVSGVEVA